MNQSRFLFSIYRLIYVLASILFLFFTLRPFLKMLFDLRSSYRKLNPDVKYDLKRQGGEVLRRFLPRLFCRAWPLLAVILAELLIWIFLSIENFR